LSVFASERQDKLLSVIASDRQDKLLSVIANDRKDKLVNISIWSEPFAGAAKRPFLACEVGQ